jgi:phenol 2-monooxygenase
MRRLAYNLGWKIASVVNGISSRSILSTYETERRQIARDLIAFDHKFSRLFSGRPARDENDLDGVNMAEFKAAYEKGNHFTSGTSVTYGTSILIAGASSGDEACINDMGPKTRLASKVHLAKNIPLGARMPSYQVLNQCDARPWQFQEILKSDGRWRVVVFAGDVTIPRQKERIQTIGRQLTHPKLFPRRFTHSSKPIDSVIEVLTIHSAPRHEVDLFDFPETLRPFSEETGWNYWKIYVDAQSHHEGHGQAYLNYGVDPTEGCLVVLRPDQHVSYIGGLEDLDAVNMFFSEFMNPTNTE